MDIPDFKTCKVIKIEFNKQIIDRYDSKLDFRGLRAVRSNRRASPIKEKCRKAFFTSRLILRISSSGRSRYIRVPLTTVFCFAKIRSRFVTY